MHLGLISVISRRNGVSRLFYHYLTVTYPSLSILYYIYVTTDFRKVLRIKFLSRMTLHDHLTV